MTRCARDGFDAVEPDNLDSWTRSRHLLTRAGNLAVAEDCEVYRECGRYRSLYGRHVLEVEYADRGDAPFARACAERGSLWAVVHRDRDLRTPGQDGYLRRTC